VRALRYGTEQSDLLIYASFYFCTALVSELLSSDPAFLASICERRVGGTNRTKRIPFNHQNMAVSDVTVSGGHAVDLQGVVNSLKDELGPAPEEPLCEAIRRGDEDAIRQHRLLAKGPSSLAPKRLAIEENRPDLLRVFLEQDNSIDENLVVAACTAKDRACVRALLDFGWPIDQTVGYDASMLRSVLELGPHTPCNVVLTESQPCHQ